MEKNNLLRFSMKKAFSVIAAASIALSASSKVSPFQNMDFKDWGKLQLVGNQLSDKNGNPVQLKGWSTVSIHKMEDVSDCLGSSQWDLMKKYGANVVRLVMDVDAPNAYLSNTNEFKAMLKGYIAEIAESDMYCLLDWNIRELDEQTGNPNLYLNEALDFFDEISKFCADNNYDNVLYEICPEPTCGWSAIKTYAEQVIPQILTNQKDAIVIVGTDMWSQNIMEPVDEPIDKKFQNNVMYSFHFSACSHFNMLSNFKSAQKSIPVFISEWNGFKFSDAALGNETSTFCESNATEFINNCYNLGVVAPQTVSWCVYGWGKENVVSFFDGACSESNESQQMSDKNNETYGNFIKTLMSGENIEQDLQCCSPSHINKIPTTSDKGWRWDYYIDGGEGIAYHDKNSTAWVFDDKGSVIDYSNEYEEVDVFSLAHKFGWINADCPWSTVVDGEVADFDESISTLWKDIDGKPTYKSLNAGRYYSGNVGSERPNEGVDLTLATCYGTDYELSGYNNLISVEKDEWIKYTVDVEKAGYYKISGIVNAEYWPNGKGDISMSLNGYNMLFVDKDFYNSDLVTSFGFERVTECSDPDRLPSEPWDCWAEMDARGESGKDVYCLFTKPGLQEIKIYFEGDVSGIGPLNFKFYKEYEPQWIICCGYDGPDDVTDVVNDATFTINPNPASGEFTIQLAKEEQATVKVVNMAGQLVVDQNIVGSATIDQNMTPGVYTVIVESSRGVRTQKLMVK